MQCFGDVAQGAWVVFAPGHRFPPPRDGPSVLAALSGPRTNQRGIRGTKLYLLVSSARCASKEPFCGWEEGLLRRALQDPWGIIEVQEGCRRGPCPGTVLCTAVAGSDGELEQMRGLHGE